MADVFITDSFRSRFEELVGDMPYRDLEDKLHISKSTISAYITGARSPKQPVLLSIARAYGVDPLWLMGGNVPKYKETPVVNEDLSDDKQHIIDCVMQATDEEVRALRGIVDQVLALRGK